MNTILFNRKPMDPASREVWLREAADLIQSEFIKKYHDGQASHGGDIGSVGFDELLTEATHESLDQLAYLAELKRRSIGMDYIVTTRKTLLTLCGTIDRSIVGGIMLNDVEALALKQARALLSGKATA